MTDTRDNQGVDLQGIETRRAEIRNHHLRPAGQRPASTARGLHHTALISSDVEQTVRFYQELLEYGTWYLVALGAVAIGAVLLAPRGLWGLVAGHSRVQLFPVGYHSHGE